MSVVAVEAVALAVQVEPTALQRRALGAEVVLLLPYFEPTSDSDAIRAEPQRVAANGPPRVRNHRGTLVPTPATILAKYPLANAEPVLRGNALRIGHAERTKVVFITEKRCVFRVRNESMLDDDARDSRPMGLVDYREIVGDASIGESLTARRIGPIDIALRKPQTRDLCEDLLRELFARDMDLFIEIAAVVGNDDLCSMSRGVRRGIDMQTHENVRALRNRVTHALAQADVEVAAARHHNAHAGVALQLGLAVLGDLQREVLFRKTVALSAAVPAAVTRVKSDHKVAIARARGIGGRRKNLHARGGVKCS